MRTLSLVVLVLLAVAALSPAHGKVSLTTFDLEAHRGGRDLYPENTLAAFRNALALNVTTLELDCQITKDGVPVVCHNPYLAGELTRDEKGRWVRRGAEPLIHQLSLEQVKTYTVEGINPEAKEYFKLHGKLQKACPGERIPTLDEVFRLVEQSGNSRVLFNIETKSFADRGDWLYNPDPQTFVSALLSVIRRHRMESRVMIQSFDWRTLLEVRRLDGDITTVALTAEQPSWGDGLYRETGKPGCSPWMAGLDIDDFGGDYVRAAKAVCADVVSPYFRELTKELVDEAHRLDMKVVPWTVNDREDMDKLIELGVDGIITDRPDLLRDVLVEKGIAF